MQLYLIPGFYRCDDCGRTVDRVRPTRRFRLCDDCYDRIVPEFRPGAKVGPDSPEQQAMTRYWEWYGDMEERVPPRRRPGHAARIRPTGRIARSTNQLFPLCDCGQRRETISFVSRAEGGLFGGPFLNECRTCRMKREIEEHARASSWLHPDWDDEEWLDLLYKFIPEAFELRILPDYWYELRRKAAKWSEG